MQALKLMKQWRKEKGEEGEATKEGVGGEEIEEGVGGGGWVNEVMKKGGGWGNEGRSRGG